jgi:hypothetical protein
MGQRLAHFSKKIDDLVNAQSPLRDAFDDGLPACLCHQISNSIQQDNCKFQSVHIHAKSGLSHFRHVDSCLFNAALSLDGTSLHFAAKAK